ncbi:Hypothetical protein GLP15_4210 [Giardia lamblia P15]|uniref:Uncharacterized protein n=1 Tax=Giardia intestinalis (strain P15) TaxID=658858 RepID=E1F0R1_GIAIA|nr:Hypothetical protein GLP15_4210 [Giardia lamblia P15]
MTQSLISHYRAQHMAQICLCLKKALDASAPEAVDQIKRAIVSFGRINESGAYFEEVRRLQSAVQTIINREKLIRQHNEEQLEVRIKAAARKMRSCAIFADTETGKKHPSQISGFSSDSAHQQLYMNLLTIPDYLDAINLLAVCRKIYVLDSCVFSAFYTAISTALLLQDSSLVHLLGRDYRTCIRILYYHTLFEEVGTTLDFAGLGIKLREYIQELCLTTPQLLAKLSIVTADVIAQALNFQAFGAAFSSVIADNILDELHDVVYTLEGIIKRITTNIASMQDCLQSRHILEKITMRDKTVCIDAHPSYISNNQDRFLVAQSIVNRLAFAPSFLAIAQDIDVSGVSASLAMELTTTQLAVIQRSVFALFEVSGMVELSLQYDSMLAYGTRSFYAPILMRLYSVILEYSVALARLESIYKNHSVSWQPNLAKASFLDGLSRILSSFGYLDCSMVVTIDEDLCTKGENSDAMKALRAFNTELSSDVKKPLAAACLQASRYGLLTYASLLLGHPPSMEYTLSLETSIFCAYKTAIERLCRHSLSAIIGGSIQPSESLISKYAHLLSFAAELLITTFVGCPLLEQYLKTPHGLCISLIALVSQTVVTALITTSNLRRTQRLIACSFLSSLSRLTLHLGSTGHRSLVYSCLGDRRYDSSVYVSAAPSSSEHEEMCVAYETYGDTYYLQTHIPLIVLGIAVKRQRVLTAFYNTKGIDSLTELIKVEQQGKDAHRLFMPGDLSAIIKASLEDDGEASETATQELISFVKSGAFIWSA